MKKAFVIIVISLLSCLFLNCKKGVTDESNLVKTSNNLDIGLPSQGLIAYYPFIGTADDASENGNNGASTTSAKLTSDRFGHSNSAYHFSGGDRINIPELFSDTILAFTFAVWVMKDNADGNTHTILYKDASQGEAALGITHLTTGTVLGFSVNIETGFVGGQNWHSYNVPDTLRANVYYFLVGRYIRGDKLDLLINGQLMGSSAVPDSSLQKSFGPGSAIGLHTGNPTATYWNGVIDDIRVYNRALSDAEVQSLYHEGGWTGN